MGEAMPTKTSIEPRDAEGSTSQGLSELEPSILLLACLAAITLSELDR